MNKNEFIAMLAEESGKTKIECEHFLKAFADAVLKGLSNKDAIPLGVLGQVKYKKNAARVCRTIKTGELKQIPEKGSASLVLSKHAKQILSTVV